MKPRLKQSSNILFPSLPGGLWIEPVRKWRKKGEKEGKGPGGRRGKGEGEKERDSLDSLRKQFFGVTTPLVARSSHLPRTRHKTRNESQGTHSVRLGTR